MAKRLLIIGLDGADLRVIRKMAQKVSMPNLGLLMQEGSCLEVESVLPVNSASAWVSFMTGKYPCRHGIYDFIRKIPGKYELDVIDSFGIKEDAIWDVLDRHGRKSVFVNFPVTYPPKEINGIMISGMLSPGETSAFVYPAVLKKELEDNIGRYLIDVAPLPYLKKNKIKEFISDLFIMTEKRRQAALYCMRKAQWDFSMVLFSGLDRMQHVLWDYLDGEVRLSGDNGLSLIHI